MTDEDFLGFEDETPPDPSPRSEAEEAEEERGVAQAIPGLLRASDLIDPADEDQGDFEPGGLYKGFKILYGGDRPQIKAHAHLRRRFYVEAPDGTVGLVPWEGSQIVWPWEAAWAQDLYRPEVESLLKEEKKEKKKKA